MRRFYKDVSITLQRAVLLDSRPIKTPKRNLLSLPTLVLAEAVATEWRLQGDKVVPATMPLTGLANAAIDVVTADSDTFRATLLPFAETDVLCYRADAPPELIARQGAQWQPLLNWAAERFDISFVVTNSILHAPQSPETITRLQTALGSYDAFALAGLSHLITIGGSLVTAFAVVEGQISADAAFDTAHLDELWQAEQWGEEWSSTEMRTARKADFLAAAQFVALATPSAAIA